MALDLDTCEDTSDGLVQLYTAAMLAQLIGVKPSVIRRWTKRGWLRATREVRRLLYFDFAEVATARKLAELQVAGASTAQIERHLAALARHVPAAQRPLAELAVVIEGKHLLVRQGEELVEPGGQLRFDFSKEAAAGAREAVERESVFSISHEQFVDDWAESPQKVLAAASQLEEDGEHDSAIDLLRAALASRGPNAELNFMLAELLYQMGDLSAARERYYSTIEIDEDYVEARANLGCVLAEIGEQDLAIAAFRGALEFHPDYADVHYHLARVLDEAGQADSAEAHWHTFIRLAPTSPWADEARLRLEE